MSSNHSQPAANPWHQSKRLLKGILWGLALLVAGYMVVLAFTTPPVPNAVYNADYVNKSATTTNASMLGVDHVLVNTQIHFGKNYMTITRAGINAGKAGRVISTTKFSTKQVTRDNVLARYVIRTMKAQINLDRSQVKGGRLTITATDGTKLRFSKDHSRFTVQGQTYTRTY